MNKPIFGFDPRDVEDEQIRKLCQLCLAGKYEQAIAASEDGNQITGVVNTANNLRISGSRRRSLLRVAAQRRHELAKQQVLSCPEDKTGEQSELMSAAPEAMINEGQSLDTVETAQHVNHVICFIFADDQIDYLDTVPTCFVRLQRFSPPSTESNTDRGQGKENSGTKL
jgi:hypothetical protein